MSASEPLSERYFFLSGNESRPIDVPVPVPEFWRQLIGGEPTDAVVADVASADGWLVTRYDMSDDTATSEMHPEGDELHYLVSGALDLVLEHDDRAVEVVSIDAGESAMVGRGVWHRFVVREPAVGIAVTFGRGTQHRPTSV